MPAVNQCPRCGTELSPGDAQGLCPSCLMQVGMESPTATGASQPALGRSPAETPTESHADEADAVKPSPKPAADLPEPGQQFGKYRLVRWLGKGGMGAVFEADDLEKGRRVALKLLAHSLESPEARNRFFREGRLAGSINHPNSVYVYGTEEIDGTPAISMEHVVGGTLHECVRQGGPLPVVEAVDAILQIIDGLEAAASVGVLHRDVKPSNCFVDAEGTVKVGDFGLSISTAVRGDKHLTTPGSFLGTPAFSSPEQLRGDELDLRSDIYAVGATLFYLLTGRTPYEANNLVKLLATVLEQPAPSPAKFRKEIPQGLAKAILRCLAKQPSNRFKNYAELRKALIPYNSTAPTPATLAYRFAAGLCDHFLWTVPVMAIQLAVSSEFGWHFSASTDPELFRSLGYIAGLIVGVLLWGLYFAIPEGLWGASLGKAICRLRVVDRSRNRIGVPRAIARTAIYLILPSLIAWTYWTFVGLDVEKMTHEGSRPWIPMLVMFSYYPMLAVLFSTARRRNGYSGLHDLAVGSQVILRAAYHSRPRLEVGDERLPDLDDTKTIGPYHLLDELDTNEAGQFLLGYDLRLLRRVWIHQLPAESPAISVERRNMGRVGRLRWIDGQRGGAQCWDVYEALYGQPLLKLIEQPQSWNVVRYWLLDLAQELDAATKDGTLPSALRLDRVWITAAGRVKLLDFPAPGTQPASETVERTAPDQPTSVVAAYLLQVAKAALHYDAGAMPADTPDQVKVCFACDGDLRAVLAQSVVEGDETRGVIPYKNPQALISYYLGILSGVPIIGLPLGIAAFILGVRGLKARREYPVIKGSVHAGIGIGCGCLFSLLWGGVIVTIIIAILSKR
ncbi:MAG: protein kinase [Pirellulaceae bacterium]|nr:protein kinase [Pirellulaceae bacterium]